jgi:hypothetical protein
MAISINSPIWQRGSRRRCPDVQRRTIATAASATTTSRCCIGSARSWCRFRPRVTRLTMQSELVRLWRRARFTSLLVTHDVEEALLLASRVIVLSERPARIIAEVRNDQPYPRHRGSSAMIALRRHVLELLGLADQ